MEETTQDYHDDQELFEHFRFEVDPGQSLLRVDKFLMSRIEKASRNRIQAAASAGLILVNEIPVKSSYKVKPGDVITVMMQEPQREIKLIAQDIPLEVVYEDNDLIVINKMPGMVVHPGYGNYSGTLVNALMFRFQKEMEADQKTAPYLVHRIDKNTSGLIIAAKNEATQVGLQKQFFHHDIERKYVALVWGEPTEEEGVIQGNIARSKKDRKVYTVYEDEEIGKHAITNYRIIEKFGYVTVVECELETGRTHQIRVHMKYLGHPLFNDDTYGGDKILRGTTFSKYQQFIQNCFKLCPRQALHARVLGFNHPGTGKNMHFESDLPEDLRQVIDKWRNYAVHKGYEE